MNLEEKFKDFCGGEFWNSTITWHSPNPTLTNCFLWTVVAWVPCSYFMVFSPIYYFCYLRRVNNVRSEHCGGAVSMLYVLKIITSSGLIATSLSCLIYCIVIYVTKDAPEVSIVTPIIITMVFTLSTIIIKIEYDKRLVTSGFHSFFYFLLSISSTIYGYSLVWQYLYHWDINISDKLHATAYTTCYILFTTQIVVMLITFCFPDPVAVRILKKKNPNVCPESTTTFFSGIVFTWIFRLLLKGYKKPLTIADLWNRFDGQDATLNRKKFFAQWKKKRSVVNILVRMFGPKLLLSHISMFLSIIAMFVVPFLLSIFIEYFDDPYTEDWKGYLCGVAFFVNYVFESLCWQQMIYLGFDVGARVKGTLTSVAFQKILLLDTSFEMVEEQESGVYELVPNDDHHNRNKTSQKASGSAFPTTPGEAVNLISTDIFNIGEATAQLHQAWAIPLQTAMVLGILWWLLDTSLVFMIVIVFVVLIIILITSRFLKSLQISQLKQKDGRIKIFTEVINGIKLLKLYTWEGVFEERIQNYRRAELRNLRRFFYINAINIFSSLYTPNLATFITFSIYSWFIGPLTARKAFTSKSVFNLLQYQLLFMPIICSHIVKVRVSLRRVEAFLNLPELKNYVDNNSPLEKHDMAIQVTNGIFSWDATPEPTLKNINMNLKRKSLTAVVGLIGSGKSSLLSSILGEIRKLEGGVRVKGSLAYISQQAWIQNATLRDNILFGLSYQEAKYNKIVEACALKHDLDTLAAGDMTIIGEKGTNLSGGQKQRVSLARSLYQDSDIYLFDDPLSAVDSHVAKHIFNHVIGPAGYLKNKTRVLVTHAVSFLQYTDCIIVLDEGQIVEQGSYKELSRSGGRLSRFIEAIESFPASFMNPDGSQPAEMHPLRSRTSSVARTSSIARTSYRRKPSLCEGFDKISSNSSSLRHDDEPRIEDEGESDFHIVSPESVGEVKFGTYKFYASQLGYLTLTLVVLFFVISKSFAVMSNVWVSYWTDDKLLMAFILNGSSVTPTFNETTPIGYYERQKFYITSYAWFVGGHALFLILYCIISVEGNTNASKQTHSAMLYRIIRAPLSFFETTPTGRILNRFSRDLDVLDTNLPDLKHQWLAVFTSLISTVIIITMNIPIFIVIAIVLVVIFLFLQSFYLPTVRQLKWEESNSRSPIYANVCEALTGLDTIRAFKKQPLFLRRFDKLVNNNTIFNFTANAAERWLGFHLEMLGACTTFAASMFSVTNRSSLSGSTVGMFMASSIQDSFSLCYLVRLNSSLETNMVSMVRLKEYLNVDIETDAVVTSSRRNKMMDDPDNDSKQMFKRGKIEFQNYCMRYRPDLDYSLKNINILISPREKVGIIGRTGAGKSSLISALFRFNRYVDGKVFIDDVDTSTLPLKVLRSGITVLPQDPIVFSGTIRMNLDPLSLHSDPEILDALSKIKMLDYVKGLPGLLDFVCQSDGLNFSVGQRQLLCLGRTLLHKTSILILDEATAAVDLETDKVIQETIRTQFSDCTVLTIAHRINTILSCDRIMLLDSGSIKEFGSPNNIPGMENDNNDNPIVETERF